MNLTVRAQDADPHVGARLVALDDDGSWRGFAITSGGTVDEVVAVGGSREHAKEEVVQKTLELLSAQTADQPGHTELAALRPFIDAVAA